MTRYSSIFRVGLISFALVALPLYSTLAEAQPKSNNRKIRFSEVTINDSDLFFFAGLPETDLPAVGKGGIQPRGDTHEIDVNPLKFNGGLVSPITPIRTLGGTSQTPPGELVINNATIQFGGVKPSACKIPGLGLRAILCGATISNTTILLTSGFQSGDDLTFSIFPSTENGAPSILQFVDDPQVMVCDDLDPPLLVQRNPCTINLSLALGLAGLENIFAGIGSIQ